MTWPDGFKYEGEWKDDQRTGKGTLTSNNGVRYVGQWQDNKFIGPFKDKTMGLEEDKISIRHGWRYCCAPIRDMSR